MKTLKPFPAPLARAVSALGLAGFSVVPAFAQQRDYVEARVYVTAPSPQQLLADRGFSAFEPLEQPDENFPTIMIDPDRTFQTIEGFGGAFTDAAADVFAQLPKAAQEAFLEACFDPVRGNGYTLCRTTIHSCDYASGMYTYAEVPGDKKLEHFSIEHDLQNRLPLIKRAQAAANGKLRLYASPWSPPGWMKTNGEMKHGGKLKPEYRQTWADYFVKYVKAYAAEGVPIWGLTVQNEALATQVWESCLFTANEERDFVRDYLGPTLHRHGLADVKLMIWDHNRGLMYQRAAGGLQRPQGIEVHLGHRLPLVRRRPLRQRASRPRRLPGQGAALHGGLGARHLGGRLPPRQERHPGPQPLDRGLDRLEPAARPRRAARATPAA